MNKIRLVIGLVIFIASMIYLTAYAIPNYFKAQETLRQAEIDVAESQAEADQALADLNTAVDEIANEESIQ
jgi:hypothetical protein